MEKLLKYLSKLPAFYGLIIYSLIALYNSNIAIAIVMCTAIGKELYDSYHRDIYTAYAYDGLATFAVPLILWILGVML